MSAFLSTLTSSWCMARNDLQASRTVCSLITISVVSALGLETLDAIAAASVSRMILSSAPVLLALVSAERQM